MALPSVDPEVERVLVVVVGTVERLEILLRLRHEAPRPFTAKALGVAMSIAPSVAGTHLAILCSRGFLSVTLTSDLVYTYQPLSPKIAHLADDVAHLWQTRRAEVVALLG